MRLWIEEYRPCYFTETQRSLYRVCCFLGVVRTFWTQKEAIDFTLLPDHTVTVGRFGLLYIVAVGGLVVRITKEKCLAQQYAQELSDD